MSVRSRQVPELATAFGAVPAARDPRGTIYVLDGAGFRIAMLDTALGWRGSAGRRGAGPGEYVQPVSVQLFPDGRLAVLDRALRRIVVLAPSRGQNPLVVSTTVTLGTSAEAMCTLPDGRFLVYGFSEGYRLRVLDSTGRVLRAFAPVEPGRSAMASDLLAAGVMSCAMDRDEVLLSSRFLPVIEAFRLSTGERIWVDTLRPFRPMAVTDRGRSVTISSGPHGYSRVQSVLNWNGLRIVQAGFEGRKDGGADTVVTYVYDIRSGTWTTQLDLPVLVSLGGAQVLSVEGDDPPTFRIYRLEERETAES